MNTDSKQPRKLPQSQPMADAQEFDPSIVVLDALDAMASAMEMQATIAAANFIAANAESEDDKLKAFAALTVARDAALAYLRDAGQNDASTAAGDS